MALVFDERYYNGAPEGYTRYGRGQWGGRFTFSAFADSLVNVAAARGVSLSARRVLVAGCAYGFTVEELRARGVNAWGMDVSAYAVSQAPEAVRPYVLQGNVLSTSDLDRVRSAAGLKGKSTFDLAVDEDLLTCLADTDAVTACQNLRAVAARVAHRLTVHPLENPDYNVKTLAEWRALCDPSGLDWWYEYTSWREG